MLLDVSEKIWIREGSTSSIAQHGKQAVQAFGLCNFFLQELHIGTG